MRVRISLGRVRRCIVVFVELCRGGRSRWIVRINSLQSTIDGTVAHLLAPRFQLA